MKWFWKLIWDHIVQPNPHEDRPPQDGPIELWTSRPSREGERPERKIAGVGTVRQAHRIAEGMGLIVYHVLGSPAAIARAKFESEMAA